VSTSRTKAGNASKLCLDMQINQLPNGGSHGNAVRVNNSIGLVSIQGAVGVTNATFTTTIPRQKWTHIAFVCTRKPKNRITCYKVDANLKQLTFLCVCE
jgi:hypothetical protein